MNTAKTAKRLERIAEYTLRPTDLPLLPPFDEYFFRDGQLLSRARSRARGKVIRTVKHGQKLSAFVNVVRFGRAWRVRIDVEEELAQAEAWRDGRYGIRRPYEWVEKGMMSLESWQFAQSIHNPDLPTADRLRLGESRQLFQTHQTPR